MKKNILKAGWFLSILSVLFYCTSEKVDYKVDPKFKAISSSFKGGDTIIYYRGPDYVTLPFGKGNYTSPWCDTCLFMDKHYGKIDLQKTEAGIYFPITYNSSYEKINVNVLVSGVRYRDGVYKLGSGEKLLKPYYNAGNDLAPQGSYFDIPPAGWPSLTAQGVVIDPNTGIIDLEQTIQNGAWRGIHKKDLRMYFRLNDASNRALNYTDITIIFSPISPSGRTTEEGVTTDERCRTRAEVVK